MVASAGPADARPRVDGLGSAPEVEKVLDSGRVGHGIHPNPGNLRDPGEVLQALSKLAYRRLTNC